MEEAWRVLEVEVVVPWPRIHCGSEVMVSPGTTVSLARFVGRVSMSGMEESVSEAEEVGEGLEEASSGLGGRMSMPIFTVVNGLVRSSLMEVRVYEYFAAH